MGVVPIQSVVTAAHGLIAGWGDRGPLNQYARTNYRSDQTWATWRNADCSAAALDWLLGAYGQQLGSLDDVIALVGPGTGISSSLGFGQSGLVEVAAGRAGAHKLRLAVPSVEAASSGRCKYTICSAGGRLAGFDRSVG